MARFDAARPEGEREMRGSRLRRCCGVVPLLFLACCATTGTETGSRARRGASRSVAWEVIDMRKDVAADGQQISWRYTIVLQERSGHDVRFVKHSRSFQHENLAPIATESEFQRQLAAQSELRVSWMFREHPIDASRGVVQRGAPIRAWHRFEGADDSGEPVTVDVQFDLD